MNAEMIEEVNYFKSRQTSLFVLNCNHEKNKNQHIPTG